MFVIGDVVFLLVQVTSVVTLFLLCLAHMRIEVRLNREEFANFFVKYEVDASSSNVAKARIGAESYDRIMGLAWQFDQQRIRMDVNHPEGNEQCVRIAHACNVPMISVVPCLCVCARCLVKWLLHALHVVACCLVVAWLLMFAKLLVAF